MQILITPYFLIMVRLNSFSLDDDTFDDDDPETIIRLELWLGVININNTRHVKNRLAKN